MFTTKSKKIKEENFILISPNEKKDGSLFCEIEVFETPNSAAILYTGMERLCLSLISF